MVLIDEQEQMIVGRVPEQADLVIPVATGTNTFSCTPVTLHVSLLLLPLNPHPCRHQCKIMLIEPPSVQINHHYLRSLLYETV